MNGAGQGGGCAGGLARLCRMFTIRHAAGES